MAASVAAMSAYCEKASPPCGLVPPTSSLLPTLLRRRRGVLSSQRLSYSPSLSVQRKSRSLCVRAIVSPEESSAPDFSKQLEETFEELKAKYDSLENKSTVWIYGGGALVALWLSSIIIGAVNNVPLLPKILELVGLGYSGWFVYRYILFKSSRKQLVADIEELKLKISGVPRSAFMTEDDE